MSNRLTFGEAEFLLKTLRDQRIAFQNMRNITPIGLGTMADFAGMKHTGAIGEIPTRDWQEEIDERMIKLDVIIEKIEGLFSL